MLKSLFKNRTLGLTLAGIALAVVSAFAINNSYENRPFNPEDTMVVYASPGGEIFSHIEKYNKLDDEGKYLKIDGPCVSACTYFLNLVKPNHVCATEKAYFGFHGIYNMLGFLGPVVQRMHPLVYPQRVIELLKTKGFDGTRDVDRTKYPDGIIWLTREELLINPCED